MSSSLTSTGVTLEPFLFTAADYKRVGSRFCSMQNLVRKERKTGNLKLGYKRMNGENMRVGVSKQVVDTISKEEEVSSGGLGISNFIAGKVFLVTGATGFLAKVLIEKILRTIPDVGKIYLLIKANNKKEAMHRIKTEIINTELFKCLKQLHGESYEKFLLSKLVPVVGDLCADDLGMEFDVAANIAEDVDFIVNSAGNTNFHERYDVALNINTLGPCRLLHFAKSCKQLKLFLHVSTAYVNGEREGLIKEKLFCNGDSIAKEKAPMESFPLLDVEAEIKMAMDAPQDARKGNLVSRKMKEMGFDRARSYGWQDVYVFTKAMGEMMIETRKENVPVAIIRPSIIESTYCEPIPGWILGIRMADPFILSIAKGEISGFPMDVNGIMDVIPVDMVVNAMLAATVKHATTDKPGGRLSSVYHIGSSVVNPLVYQEFLDYIFAYYDCFPYMNMEGRPIEAKRFKLFNNMDDFYTHIDEAKTTQTHKKSLGLAKVYGPYTLYKGRFDSSNTQKLLEEMSEEERKSFNFDVKSLDWNDYFLNIHIPGMMTYEVKQKKELIHHYV